MMKSRFLFMMTLSLCTFIHISAQKPGGVEGILSRGCNAASVRLGSVSGLTYVGVNRICSEKEQTIWSVGTASSTTLVQTTGRTADLKNSLFMNYATDTLPELRLYSYGTSRTDCSGKTLYLGTTKNRTLPTANLKDSTGEYIVFGRHLSTQERNRVESYLALKYGITLSHSYLNSHGTVIWNVSEMSKYGHRIAGIICDSISALYHRNGSSSQKESFMTFSDRTLKDGNSLLWGDDGNKLSFASDVLGGRWLSRRWAAVRAGSSSDPVTVKVDVSDIRQIQPLNAGESYYLAVDNSGTGKFSVGNLTYYKAGSVSTDSVCFESVSLGRPGQECSVFTLRAAKNLFTTLEVLQPEQVGGLGRLRVLITGGIPPYALTLSSDGKSVYSYDTSDCTVTTGDLSDGAYTLVVKDKVGNVTTDDFRIVDGEIHKQDTTSETDMTDMTVLASPNPTSDGYVKIQVEYTESSPLKAWLYTSGGGELDSYVLGADTYHTFSVYLPQKATYILKIQSGDKSKSIKLMRK